MAVLGDPESFPISVDDGRDPMNWYGRTKLIGERLVEEFAADTFPAHLFLKSNLYGEHTIDGQRVSKGTVINFFVNRVFDEKPLTVYEPGTQSRNYIHVDDVARAYVRSAERLQEQLNRDETGIEKYEIASKEDPGIMTVAETVRQSAQEEIDTDVDVTLVENPRSGETLVDRFEVDISKAREQLNWEPQHTVESSIRRLLQTKNTE
jgi:UDP-glucose 4-epimerase